MKGIVVLGSTGSIGTSALKVVSAMGDHCRIVGLCAGGNVDLLMHQAETFSPQWIYAAKGQCSGYKTLANEDELCAAVAADDVDIVLCAVVGTAGLRPVLSAIRAGKDIALASKEIMVMAGAIVTAEAKRYGCRILPVDSEHCAIFQCLNGEKRESVKRVILTCSGGPFNAHPEIDLSKVTLADTLKHPTWAMGKKITIDCATLMNKGLEMIEARWLFDMPENKIDVVIHPQSIVHSMVEYCDGSVLAQLGCPDMCLPIHYCLNYPERVPSPVQRLDFSAAMHLDFLPPDEKRFPALRLARNVLRGGSAAGALFNAANEIAVNAFCNNGLTFDRIPAVVEKVLDKMGQSNASTLDEILAADKEARRLAEVLCRQCQNHKTY